MTLQFIPFITAMIVAYILGTKAIDKHFEKRAERKDAQKGEHENHS